MATEAELVRELQDLLHLDPENPTRLTSRENSRLEYKERFNWASRAKYGKTLAAFGNNAGGFIVFGVQDSRKCRFGRRVRYVGDGHNALHPPAAERLPRIWPIHAVACTREDAEIDFNPLSVCLRENSGAKSYCFRTAS